MHILRIEGATRFLGAPANWAETTDIPCGTLPIRDEQVDGCNVMVSAWEPSPEDLVVLALGGKIYLHIWGSSHPVVGLGVGGLPEAEAEG